MSLLPFNCLLENTQLYKDLSDFVRKIMINRIADGKDVSINDVYKEAREGHFLDVDMNTVGEMYKEIAPSLKAPKGTFDSNSVVDQQTGKILNNAVRKIISKQRKKTLDEVGTQKPSAAIATDIVRLFEGDFVGLKDQKNKTLMKEMQDAVKKAATAILERKGATTKNIPFEEILNEALRVDELSVKDLNGQLNTIDKLFDEVSKEIDSIVEKLEKSKRGMSPAKQAEIDMRIEQFQNYTKNIQQGAYTLALTRAEQQKVLRDILKQKFGKDVTVNGKKTRVMDWNKLFRESKDVVSDISDILTSKGYTQSQIAKIANSLKVQYDALKASAQWNNIASNGTIAAVNDDNFLTRAAAQVVMSKKDSDGKYYKVYNPQTRKDEPDWQRWAQDKGQSLQQLKDEIKQDITTKGNASAYRQIVSELARMNNPAKQVSKSDLEQLSRMADIYGFDPKFNAKVYKILGISDSDTQAGEEVEELTKKIKEVLDKGGNSSKIAMSKLLDDINNIMAKTQGSKSGLLRFARWFEWVMGNRNAFRLITPINVVENTLSGAAQIIQTGFQSMSLDVAKKELSKMMNIAADVAEGGKHFDIVDAEKLSFVAHDYRYDKNKDFSHNVKALMSVAPNLMLGVMDSATHSYTMRVMFYNSAVKFRMSKLNKDKVNGYLTKGYSEKEAKEMASREKEATKKQAIEDVTNALYDPTEEVNALKKAEEILKLVTPNPNSREIQREADNLMFNNIVQKGIMNESQLEALKRAADTAAKKSTGKVSDKWVDKMNGIPYIGGITNGQMKMREKIKDNIQEGEYNAAARNILLNAIVYKGLFPFVKGAFNWGVIGVKKAGLGLLSGIALSRQSFKEQVEMAADLDDKKLEEIMEKNATLRNEMYYTFQGLVWTSLIMTAVAAFRPKDDDDEKNWLEHIDKEVKKFGASSRQRSYLTRWSPPLFHAYNILSGNIKGDKVDLATQYSGLDVLESPITKYTKYSKKGDSKGAAMGALMGGVFDMGSYYNSPNSWMDAFSKEQTEKVSPTTGYYSDKKQPFLSGVIYGLMGYRLNQDLKHYKGFENLIEKNIPFTNK